MKGTDFMLLKSQHENGLIDHSEYTTKVEELFNALKNEQGLDEKIVKIIEVIDTPGNPDMKGEAKWFAMESVLKQVV
jgi:hypothetical protein